VKKSEKYTQTFADCQANESIFSLLALSKKKTLRRLRSVSSKTMTT